MLILDGVFDLLVEFASHSFLSLWLYPMIAYGFILSVPGFIRSVTSWR